MTEFVDYSENVRSQMDAIKARIDGIHAEMSILKTFDTHRFDEGEKFNALARDGISNRLDERDRRYEERWGAMNSLVHEIDKRHQQRFDAQQLANQDALGAQEKAVNAALAAADRAVAKAEAASEKRFDSVNEFRATLSDQASSLMPRGEAEAKLAALSERLAEVTRNNERNEGKGTGQSQLLSFLFMAAASGAAVASAVFAVTKP